MATNNKDNLIAEIARLRGVIREAAAKLAGRPVDASAWQLDSLIDDVLADLTEVEDEYDSANLPDNDPA